MVKWSSPVPRMVDILDQLDRIGVGLDKIADSIAELDDRLAWLNTNASRLQLRVSDFLKVIGLSEEGSTTDGSD